MLPKIRELKSVHPDNFITSDRLTEYEYTQILAIRCDEIQTTGVSFAPPGMFSTPKEMAEWEILNHQCPLRVRRLISPNCIEIREVRYMQLPHN